MSRQHVQRAMSADLFSKVGVSYVHMAPATALSSLRAATRASPGETLTEFLADQGRHGANELAWRLVTKLPSGKPSLGCSKLVCCRAWQLLGWCL